MNPDLDIDYDLALERVADSLTQLQRDLIAALCDAPNNEAAAGLLAPLLGLTHHAPLNTAIAGIAKQLTRAAGIEPPKRGDGSSQWWNVVAVGRQQEGRFYWKLRPRLRDAALKLGLLPDPGRLFPESVEEAANDVLFEGAAARVPVNAYERNHVARRRCIAHYGTSCAVCGFSFGAFYGSNLDGVIHVHHLTTDGIAREIDPIRDLRPVCANCHVTIHHNGSAVRPLTIEKARELVRTHGGRPTMVCS